MPVILILRGTMSGVHLLVDCLKERTDIPCVSREDLEEIVDHHGKLAKRVLEKLAHGGQRRDLSQQRTPVDGTRTGLAWGSLFNGLLGVVRRVMTEAGLTSYWQAMQVVKKLRWQAPAQTGEAYHA